MLADIDPLYAGLSASDAKKVMAEALPRAQPVRRDGRLVPAVTVFLQDFVSTRGAMEVTSSDVMNPFAGGGSNNLYRCFIDLSFRLVAPQGYAALIHQDGHLGDPDAQEFRKKWFCRIVKHFNFVNMIQAKNFTEVAKVVQFSVNVYRGVEDAVKFDQFTYGYLPSQVDSSYGHDGVGPIGGLRWADNRWNTSGHRDRIYVVDQSSLEPTFPKWPAV